MYAGQYCKLLLSWDKFEFFLQFYIYFYILVNEIYLLIRKCAIKTFLTQYNSFDKKSLNTDSNYYEQIFYF